MNPEEVKQEVENHVDPVTTTVSKGKEVYPLVTVNILSFNRKDELRNTLTKVYEQDYKNIEVIVVDNASSDGSPQMVETEFPNVILIKMPKNVGIAGWNEGFKIAKGEYVLVLDDDSYPLANTIKDAIKIFYSESLISIVALNIYNTYLKKSETSHFNKYPFSFVGCGAIIKKKTLSDLGFYDDNIFIYHNEYDFSIRVLNSGERIFYSDELTVHHTFSSLSRKSKIDNLLKTKFRYKNFFWSYFVFIRKNFSKSFFLILLTKLLLNRTLIAITHFYVKQYGEVFFRIITNYGRINRNKCVIKKEIQKKYVGIIDIVDRDFYGEYLKLIKNYIHQ